MLFTDIDILDENLDYQAHQWVGVKDGTIDYIGDAAPENAADYGETYDGRGRLLMPALYNAHTHLPMTLLRGYAIALSGKGLIVKTEDVRPGEDIELILSQGRLYCRVLECRNDEEAML